VINGCDPEKIHAMRMDVTSENDWKEAVKTCLAKWDQLDICCNNAGTTYKNKVSPRPSKELKLTSHQPSLEVTLAEFQRVFQVNVTSVFLSIQAVVPVMKDQGGGSIINISSIGTVRPRPGLVWYNSSKGAVTNVIRTLF
jgi:NAD(P)-dependent dehydrogenase (short-subunit alcohol dehydrogenase family)